MQLSGSSDSIVQLPRLSKNSRFSESKSDRGEMSRLSKDFEDASSSQERNIIGEVVLMANAMIKCYSVGTQLKISSP